MVDVRTPLSRAFFLELILAFVIFTACAIVCLQVFAASNSESARSAAITHLGIKSQQIAETFKMDDVDISKMVNGTDGEHSGDTLTWYYDQKLNPVGSDAAYFVLTCKVDDSQPLHIATISLTENSQDVLFTFDVNKYHQDHRAKAVTNG